MNKDKTFEAIGRFERGLQIALSDAYVDTKLKIEWDNSTRSWILNIVQKTWADQRNMEYKYPLNWFEALKDAIYPESWKRFIKYKMISFAVLYPDFKPIEEKYSIFSRER